MNGVTKESLRSLQSSHFVAPRAFDETKRIERFLTASRQQGTGYKLILLLKHCQLSKCGVYSINVSHNHLGLWSNLIVTSLGHGSALHTLKLRGCGLDDECGTNISSQLGKNTGAQKTYTCKYVGQGVLSKIIVYAGKIFANIAGQADCDSITDTKKKQECEDKKDLIQIDAAAGEISTYRSSWRHNY